MFSKFGLTIEGFNNYREGPDFIDPYEDPGDSYDDFKWDFGETKGMTSITIDGYPYKVRKTNNSREKAKKLHDIRKEINRLCEALSKNKFWRSSVDPEFTEGMKIFLDIHGEYPRNPKHVPEMFKKRASTKKSSKYLISEIPNDPVGNMFDGLNKPKMRHQQVHSFPVGPDKNIRCGYRDVFIKHDLTGSNLRKLLLHELSHTGANHCTWEDDNHHEDFKRVERLVTKVANDIGFLN